MCVFKILDDTTQEQLVAFVGGETLRREALMYDQVKLIKRSSSRLTKAFLESGLAKGFCELIGQLRRDIIYLDEDARDLKIVAWRFDHCHKIFIQFSTFLMLHVDRDSYIKLFEGFHGQLEIDAVFHVLRPKFAREIHLLEMQTVEESSIAYAEGHPALKSVIQSTTLSDKMASLITSLFHVSFW